MLLLLLSQDNLLLRMQRNRGRAGDIQSASGQSDHITDCDYHMANRQEDYCTVCKNRCYFYYIKDNTKSNLQPDNLGKTFKESILQVILFEVFKDFEVKKLKV